MNHKGTITSWHDDKGYGFISPRAGGGEVFVHVSAFDAGGRRPQIGDVVRYGVSTDSRGRVRAARAAIRGAPGSAKRESTTSALPPIFVVGFLAVIGGAAITSAIPTLIPPLYLVVSALTFTVYALDKSAARRGA